MNHADIEIGDRRRDHYPTGVLIEFGGDLELTVISRTPSVTGWEPKEQSAASKFRSDLEKDIAQTLTISSQGIAAT